MKRKYGALILAGGKARRMGGKNKALLQIEEQTFFERLSMALEDFDEKIVSSNDSEWMREDKYLLLKDENLDCGPIEGLRRALTCCKSDALFVAACDMPFITKDFVAALLAAAEGHDALICRDREGGLHPLCGVYSKACLPVIEKMMTEKDYRIRKIADQTDHVVFSMEETEFQDTILANVNTLSEFEASVRACKKQMEEKNMYQYVFFDLDGTLTDPGIGITNSVMYALKKWNIEVADRRELYKFIGPPLEESFQKYYGFSEEDAMKAVQTFREYFRTKGIYENEIFDGTETLLAKVKESGRKIVLATSKPQEFAEIILKHFHIDQYFDYVAGATMDCSRNKKKDVILYALEQCGITDRSQVIMVGDREHDIHGAKLNGLASVGVLCGYGSREELQAAGADYIAEKIEDVFDVFA